MNRLHLKSCILLMLSGLMSLTLTCSYLGDSNGSGVGNGMITGKLYEADGITPANDAIVTVWDRKTQSNLDDNGIRPVTAIQEIRTDRNGMFSIEKIDPGMYAIEAVGSSNTMAQIDSIVIQTDDTHINLPPDTLKAAGAIKGTIKYANGFTTKVIIACLGPSIHFPPNNNDNPFTISQLAEGSYLLQIVPVYMNNFLFKDRVEKTVWVSSGDTSPVIIEMQMPLLMIDRISIDYDSIMHSSTINWAPIKGLSPAGYNIFRKAAGDTAFGSPLNGSVLLQSTTFVDSTAFTGLEYQYAVAAVNSNNKTGPLSQVVTTSTVNVKMTLDTTDLISEGTNMYYFIKSQEPGYLYLKHAIYDTVPCTNDSCDNYSWKIQKYSIEGNLINSTAVPEHRSFVNISNGQIFYDKLLDTVTNVIVCRSETGNERIVASYTRKNLQRIDMAGNSILIVTKDPWNTLDSSATQMKFHITRVLTDDGTLIYSKEVIAGSESLFKDALIRTDGTSCLFLSTRILQFDVSGNEIASFDLLSRDYLGALGSYSFSDSMYLIQTNSDPDSTEFAVYNFYSEQLFRGTVYNSGRMSFYLAPNGDIYIKSTEIYSSNVSSIYRFPNPFLTK